MTYIIEHLKKLYRDCTQATVNMHSDRGGDISTVIGGPTTIDPNIHEEILMITVFGCGWAAPEMNMRGQQMT